MNSFVNSMLELTLSWVRGVISDIWTMLGGNSQSVFLWLGRHWLSLVCVLVIGGITADFVFYILRWHPQRVWFAKLDRILHRASYAEEEQDFDAGYQAGIESFHLDEDPIISNYLNNTMQPALAKYDAAIPDAQNNPYEDPSLPKATPVVRHRRSERHNKNAVKRRGIRLPSLEENENAHVLYPAPPVHAREAFHNAVYPTVDNTGWESDQNAQS